MAVPETRAFLPKALDRDLVELYRSWDKMERAHHKNTIIDFDLATSSEIKAAKDREEVLARFEAAMKRDDVGQLPEAVRELVTLRLNASRTYLLALLGTRIPFADYVAQTLGVQPHLFEEAVIEHAASEVNSALEQLGLPGKSIAFTRDQALRFQEEFLIRDESRLPRQFDYYLSKWLPVLHGWFSFQLNGYDIRLEFAREDAYWKNWISGQLDLGEINFRINIHSRHVWYAGSPETLALHEYCGHAVQMILWHQRIKQGLLPQFFGILTVHFPDQFMLEGLAEVLPYILPDGVQLEKKSVVLRNLQYYTLLVMNNVHILANQPDGVREAHEYAVRRLPFTSEEVINAEIRDRRDHPLFRTYQYVYGISKHTFLTYLRKLDREAGRELLKIAYTRPMTSHQFSQCYKDLLGNMSVR